MANQALTVCRIRERIDDRPVTSFADIVDGEAASQPLEIHGPVTGVGFEAQLFVHSPRPKVPAWLSFLRSGFAGISAFGSAANGAILLVKVRDRRRDRFFAFTFGLGRHLLPPKALEPGFGLRVALNLIYEGDHVSQTAGLERLRQVDARRVEVNTLLSRLQTNRLASFDEFGLDVQRDLLGAVTGTPVDERWGTRVGGSDALHLELECDFAGLGRLCRDILRAHERKDYKVRFSWVDNVRWVRDPALLFRLEERVLELLQQPRRHHVELAPPELVDWGEVDHFRFSFDRAISYWDLNLAAWREALRRDGRYDRLDRKSLKTDRVEAMDADGNVIARWPIYRCLDLELNLDSQPYLLTGGEFFAVARGYLRALNEEIRHLRKWPTRLPNAVPGETEDHYNQRFRDPGFKDRRHFLVLDKKLVRTDRATTSVELCDLLTDGGALVHVKQKLSSSTLSHLFAQGAVSGDLLLTNPLFRRKALEQILVAATREGFSDQPFRCFEEHRISPSELEIVYAIIAPWGKQGLSARLPFFSKVNLRRHVQDLRRMGYQVACRQIQVKPQAAAKRPRAAAKPPVRPARQRAA